jgi:hypothetical protein
MRETSRSGGGTARLKADINAGRTGDKRAGFDPAAAPLGTDDEAAGAPIPEDVAEQVRNAERAPHLDGQTGPKEATAPDAAPSKAVPSATLWLAVGALLGCALIVVVGWLAGI